MKYQICIYLLIVVFQAKCKVERNPFAFNCSKYKNIVKCKAIGNLKQISKRFVLLSINDKEYVLKNSESIDFIKIISIFDDKILIQDNDLNQEVIFLEKSPST